MSPGYYKFLADALVVFHLSFVGFVLLGGAIVLRWRRAMWLHLPAVAWGIYIELSHNICPLTPLENRLRWWGGAATYQGSFVDHYIMPVLYPAGLTHGMQVSIACAIVVLNAAAYGWIVKRRVRRGILGAFPFLSNGTKAIDSPEDATGVGSEALTSLDGSASCSLRRRSLDEPHGPAAVAGNGPSGTAPANPGATVVDEGFMNRSRAPL